MFKVWDGNHHLLVWLLHKNNERRDDSNWHYAVESIVLVVNDYVVGMLMDFQKQIDNPYHVLNSSIL